MRFRFRGFTFHISWLHSFHRRPNREKQYVYGCMVFFSKNICRNNIPDTRQLTEYVYDHRMATVTIRPTSPTKDWAEIDSLVDWLIEKNKAGYQMVNSVFPFHRHSNQDALNRSHSPFEPEAQGMAAD